MDPLRGASHRYRHLAVLADERRQEDSMGTLKIGVGLFLVFLIGGSITSPVARAGDLSFESGDLYALLSNYTYSTDAIVRIQPGGAGSWSLLSEFPTGVWTSTFTYDSHRGRLVYIYSAAVHEIRTMDADGSSTVLVPGWRPDLLAARGDGLIYVFDDDTAAAGFHYLDASDVLHDLLDVTGTVRFDLGASAGLDEMIYDPRTNSLIGFVGDSTGIAIPECPSSTASCAVRIPLNAAGTQVAGPVVATSAEISTSFEKPVGAGHVPGVGILWIVDTNSNNQEPRLQLLDPTTMVTVPYASPGYYIGAAGIPGGTYSAVRGQGVTLDPRYEDLRAWSLGETGDGTQFAFGVMPEIAYGRLIEIHIGPGGIFADGFESGNTNAWSIAEP
jgi:hypothetical protein